VSLTTIVSAFAIVAILFIGTAAVSDRLMSRVWGLGVRGSPPPPRPSWSTTLASVWPGATFEALVLTLVAALWFGSLGYGGWVVLFLLLGALPAGDRWARRRLAGAPARGETRAFVASLLKYLLAGLVCVWRLT
jgi:hypothetical protein